MSVKYHRPKYEMAVQLRRGAGIAIPEAVSRAEANLEAMREDLARDLSAKVETLEPLLARLVASDRDARVIYDIAEGLIAVAGACGFSDAARAAHSLCELLDRMEVRGGYEREPLMVHVRALRLLIQPDPLPGEASEQILVGLDKVCGRFS